MKTIMFSVLAVLMALAVSDFFHSFVAGLAKAGVR